MPQDPDSIERDIERSRVQLAQAVDAIADRVSPRRVASRAASKARARIDSVVGQISDRLPAPPGAGPAGSAPGSSATAGSAGSGRLGELVDRGSALFSTGTAQARELVRRKDPAAVAAAVTVATVLALTLRRRRGHR